MALDLLSLTNAAKCLRNAPCLCTCSGTSCFPLTISIRSYTGFTVYSLNNANLKIRRRAGRLSTKISNPAVCRLLILVNSHPALYFLLEFRLCWEKLFWHEGKFSDLKSLISALAVAWAVHWQGAFRRHFAQLVKERKQECLCTNVSTFLLQVVNGLR